jgi:RimJ/RimL family protein N-acetyltransferase
MSHLLTTPRGTITIRPALPEDAAMLRELRLEALARHPEAFAADYAATAADPAEAWAEMINKNTESNRGVICVAAVEGRLIGMTGLARGHWPKTCHDAMIWGVYVSADWRELHVAEALIQECVAWAQAHGVRLVKLGVVTTNTFAIRCYARCGFTVYGIDPQVIFYNDVYSDELLMAKPI